MPVLKPRASPEGGNHGSSDEQTYYVIQCNVHPLCVVWPGLKLETSQLVIATATTMSYLPNVWLMLTNA